MEKKVVVIGGGPAGLEAALSCRRAGFQVTLVERREPGGTCVNRGCIPTRVYLQAVKAADYLRQTGCALSSDVSSLSAFAGKLRQQAAASVSQMVFGLQYMLDKGGVQFLEGEAVSVEQGAVRLADGRVLPCDFCIAATGSVSVKPEGLSCRRSYEAEELLFSEELPEELAVVGGGVLGVELAVILQSLGSRVSLFEKEARLLPGWDEDVSVSIRAHLRERGIEVTENADRTVFDDAVLCCGRKPVLPQILTEDRNFLHILGDASGLSATAELAQEAGRRIGEVLKSSCAAGQDGCDGGQDGCDGGQDGCAEREGTGDRPAGKVSSPFPQNTLRTQCVFTPLEAAMTGARAGEGLKESYYSADMSAGGAIFRTRGAFAKAVMEEDTHRLRGFHVVSSLASEVIQTGALAAARQMTAEEFLKIVPPHPTEGEILREAVRRLL